MTVHPGDRNPNWRGGKIIRSCEACGGDFALWPSKGERRFCSIRCAADAKAAGRPPGPAYVPDAYDIAWTAGEGDRRALRAQPVASDLIRCVAARDAEGVRLLLHRVSDWHALAVVLADRAVRASEGEEVPDAA